MVVVNVTIPGGMSDETFDTMMENRYEEISKILDCREELVAKLTAKDGPLENFKVEVDIV